MVVRSTGLHTDAARRRASSCPFSPSPVRLQGLHGARAGAAVAGLGHLRGSFSTPRRRSRQAKLSAIKALNQVFIWSKLSACQPTDAADEAGAGFIVLLTGSYWNTAVSQDAWVRVMVE